MFSFCSLFTLFLLLFPFIPLRNLKPICPGECGAISQSGRRNCASVARADHQPQCPVVLIGPCVSVLVMTTIVRHHSGRRIFCEDTFPKCLEKNQICILTCLGICSCINAGASVDLAKVRCTAEHKYDMCKHIDNHSSCTDFTGAINILYEHDLTLPESHCDTVLKLSTMFTTCFG